MSSYPAEHWLKKIRDYSEKEWAHMPTPFSKDVLKYIGKNSRILELGTGTGQDAIWFSSQGMNVTATDAQDTFFSAIEEKANNQKLTLALKIQNVTDTFDFKDNEFDLVYAHLVIHYFDDDEMTQIVTEIQRVLKPNGIVAVLVNSTKDPEYSSELATNGIITNGNVKKRYFSVETLEQQFGNFTTLLLDDKGNTVKDDLIGNGGLIRYIGRSNG